MQTLFKYGDIVRFKAGGEQQKVGVVLDAYSFSGDGYNAVYYDIVDKQENIMYRRIKEDLIALKISHKRTFEIVKPNMRKTTGIVVLPQRGTTGSAGYDFYANDNYTANPGEIVKVWTDVKASMPSDEVLLLNVRSSMGGKWMLANTIGVIDSDYYSNENNDGNIGCFLKNISDSPLTINRGDKIAQGIFIKYLTTDDDYAHNTRTGGFGSTGVN